MADVPGDLAGVLDSVNYGMLTEEIWRSPKTADILQKLSYGPVVCVIAPVRQTSPTGPVYTFDIQVAEPCGPVPTPNTTDDIIVRVKSGDVNPANVDATLTLALEPSRRDIDHEFIRCIVHKRYDLTSDQMVDAFQKAHEMFERESRHRTEPDAVQQVENLLDTLLPEAGKLRVVDEIDFMRALTQDPLMVGLPAVDRSVDLDAGLDTLITNIGHATLESVGTHLMPYSAIFREGKRCPFDF